jgi:hypothetical protein
MADLPEQPVGRRFPDIDMKGYRFFLRYLRRMHLRYLYLGAMTQAGQSAPATSASGVPFRHCQTLENG